MNAQLADWSERQRGHARVPKEGFQRIVVSSRESLPWFGERTLRIFT